jgi:hypothetical protein
MLGQATALLHATSHLHEDAQSIEGHAPVPVHSTSHSPGPQRIAPHDAMPLQSITHPVAWVQSTSSHASVLLHRIEHSKPGGHTTSPHPRLLLHVIWQVMAATLHDEHWLGQGASMQ